MNPPTHNSSHTRRAENGLDVLLRRSIAASNWKLHWNYAITTHLHCGKHLKTIRVLIEFANMQASYQTNVACLIIYAPRHAGKMFS